MRTPIFLLPQPNEETMLQIKLPLNKQKQNPATITGRVGNKIQRSGLLVQCSFQYVPFIQYSQGIKFTLFILGTFNAISNNSDTLSLIIHH